MASSSSSSSSHEMVEGNSRVAPDGLAQTFSEISLAEPTPRLYSDSSTIYVPIISPPTPAPSPGPALASLASESVAHRACIQLSCFRSTGEEERHRILEEILAECSPSELLFLHDRIAPLLKRDFLKDLPSELCLHILSYVEDPQTLAMASRVSRFWNKIVNNEDALWQRMVELADFEEDRFLSPSARVMPGMSFPHRKFLIDTHRTLINWRRKGRLLQKHRPPSATADGGDVTTVAMDHEWIALGLASCRIQVFSARTGVLHRTLVGHESGVWSVNIVSAGGFRVDRPRTSQAPEAIPEAPDFMDTKLDKDLRIAIGLDRPSGSAPVLVDALPKSSDACFASEGWGQPHALIVSGGCDKNVIVWDTISGNRIHVLRGHTSTVRCMRVLHNRPIAVSGARDGTLRVWDVQYGKHLRSLVGHAGSVRCLDVYGNKAVSGSYDCTCRIWDLDTGECLHELRGHMHQIYSVAYSGEYIASGGLDTTVRLWDPETGACLALLAGHSALVCQMQFSVANDILCTGGSDGRVITFCLATKSMQRRLVAHDSSVTSLQFDKHFIVTGGNDGRVHLYDTHTGDFVRELTQRAEAVWKVAFRHDKCAIMCKRAGKTVIEIWSFRPSVADD